MLNPPHRVHIAQNSLREWQNYPQLGQSAKDNACLQTPKAVIHAPRSERLLQAQGGHSVAQGECLFSPIFFVPKRKVHFQSPFRVSELRNVRNRAGRRLIVTSAVSETENTAEAASIALQTEQPENLQLPSSASTEYSDFEHRQVEPSGLRGGPT